MALTPQGGHIVRFVRREHSGPKVVYPQFLGNSGGGAGAVPGEHDGVFHAQARRAESTSFASSRTGSEMQNTAESTPSMARYN